MTSNNFALFQEKFTVKEMHIHSNDSWVLSLRPYHPTLGSSILSLKRPAENFSEISAKEAQDLSQIIAYIETTYKMSFQYDKINYLMLMMVDNHVHFHVIPRYQSTREYNGTSWTDETWPMPPDLGGKKLEKNAADAIINHILSQKL